MITKQKILLLALCMGLSIGAYAQIGFNIGYANSGLTTTSKINLNGVKAGISYDMRIADEWYMLYGLNYSFLTRTVVDKQGLGNVNNVYNFHFLELPIQGAYVLNLFDNLNVMGFLGPKLVYGISGTHKINRDGALTPSDPVDVYGSDISKLNVMLGAGLGVQYNHYRLKVGYDFGLLNQYTGLDNLKFNRNEFNVSIGYIF